MKIPHIACIAHRTVCTAARLLAIVALVAFATLLHLRSGQAKPGVELSSGQPPVVSGWSATIEKAQQLVDSRQFAEARKVLATIPADTDSSLDTQHRGQLWYLRGLCSEQAKEHGNALKFMNQAYQVVPWEVTEAAIVRLKYRRAHKGALMKPLPYDSPKSRRFNYCVAFSLRLLDPAQAILWFKPLVRYFDEFPDCLLHLYMSYLPLRDHKHALDCLEQFCAVAKMSHNPAMEAHVPDYERVRLELRALFLPDELREKGWTRDSDWKVIERMQEVSQDRLESFHSGVCHAALEGSLAPKTAAAILRKFRKPTGNADTLFCRSIVFQSAGDFAAAAKECELAEKQHPDIGNLVRAAAHYHELKSEVMAQKYVDLIAQRTTSRLDTCKILLFEANRAKDYGENRGARLLYDQAFSYCPPEEFRLRYRITAKSLSLEGNDAQVLELATQVLRGGKYSELERKLHPLLRQRASGINGQLSLSSGERRRDLLLERAELLFLLGERKGCISDLESVPRSQRNERWYSIKLTTVNNDTEKDLVLEQLLDAEPSSSGANP